MKYKVGDKVRVRKDLIINNTYGNYFFTTDMKSYVGKTMTINYVGNHAYHFEEDRNNWNWTDEMLEDVDMDKIEIIVAGNKVIAKKGNKTGVAKCSPEDEFDIFTGARLAIDRLEEKCKPYSWLEEDTVYYYPCVDIDELYNYFHYDNDSIDERLISRGLIFKTKEEAIECAKKMLEVVK